MKSFQNTNIYIENSGIKKTSLSIENGIISQIQDEISDEDSIHLNDRYLLVPGFIDEHTHGANHSDSMDASLSSYKKFAGTIPMEGTTSFLFTTMTMKKDSILKALSTINEYLKSNQEGAKAYGIHLEGPFISKDYCGAQNKEDILPLDPLFLQEFISSSGDNIKEMTFSYKEGCSDFINLAKKHHINLSLGHSDNTCKEAMQAFEEGVRITTHTFNAMRGLHHREVGLLGAAMLNERVSCELIADKIHVSEEAIKLLYKMKGKEKITLITDSMEAKYLPDGIYKLGGQDVYVKENCARLNDKTLAGSVLKMNEAIKNMKDILNISIEDAIDMATINPAKNLKLDNKIGSIKVGKSADFAIIDRNFHVYMTVRDGKIIYKENGFHECQNY